MTIKVKDLLKLLGKNPVMISIQATTPAKFGKTDIQLMKVLQEFPSTRTELIGEEEKEYVIKLINVYTDEITKVNYLIIEVE